MTPDHAQGRTAGASHVKAVSRTGVARTAVRGMRGLGPDMGIKGAKPEMDSPTDP